MTTVVDKDDPIAKDLDKRNLYARFFCRSQKLELVDSKTNQVLETFDGQIDLCLDDMSNFLRSVNYRIEREGLTSV